MDTWCVEDSGGGGRSQGTLKQFEFGKDDMKNCVQTSVLEVKTSLI